MAAPAEKLPVEVAEELKWFVWNDIWARVNSRLAGQAEGKKRQEKQRQAKQDGDRSDAHFRKAVAAGVLAKATLHTLRRQVASIGSAAATGAQEGDSRRALEVKVMDCPPDLDRALWERLVDAVKSAAVAANMMSLGQDQDQAKPLQAKFEESWREFEQDVGSYYAEDEVWDDEDDPFGGAAGGLGAGSLPRGLAAELKWFAWNRIWARVNAELAQRRGAEEGKRRLLQSKEDGRRAEAHFEAGLRHGGYGEETLQHYRRQVDALGALAAESLEDGRWLRVAGAEALPPPAEVGAELWGEIVRAAKCAGVAANVMSREDNLNMSFQAEFEEAWGQLEGG